MQEGAAARRRSKTWLMLSLFMMHGVGWCGVYRFLYVILEPGKMLGYIGIGIAVLFLADCICRWQEVFYPIAYHTKWYLLLEAFVLYLYGIFRGDIPLGVDALFMGLLVIVGHFWCLYLQGIYSYLEQNAEYEHVPGDSMLHINTGLVMGMLGVLAVFLFLAAMLQFDQAAEWLAYRLGRVMTAVVLAIHRIVRALEQLFHITPGETEAGLEEPVMTAVPELEGSEEGLGYILGISIFSIATIAVFLRMILRARLQGDLEPGARPEFHVRGSGDDIVEQIEEERLSLFLVFRNNRERVRYRFKRRVSRHYKKHVPRMYTAWEFHRELAGGEEREELDRLTRLYEIARYSRREISDRDLKK